MTPHQRSIEHTLRKSQEDMVGDWRDACVGKGTPHKHEDLSNTPSIHLGKESPANWLLTDHCKIFKPGCSCIHL